MEIGKEEYLLRLNKVRTLLKTNNLDALAVPLGVNFRYLYGSKSHLSERLSIALMTTITNDPELICPAFEVNNFKKEIYIANDNIHPWEEVENPYSLFATICKDLGITDGRIALCPTTPFKFYSKLQQALPKAIFSDGDVILSNARKVKTEKEIELLREATKATSLGIEATFNKIHTGLKEKEIAQIVATEMAERSGEPAESVLVQIGSNSAIPHGLPTDKKLQQHDVLLIDAGTTAMGYNGDITNTTVFGKPSKKFLEVYSIVEEANERALNKTKHGAIPREVDAAARDFIEQKGYGKYFTHRTGHGIGLEVHEEPYIVGTNTFPLVTNEIHSDEPGIYIPGEFGVRIEDDVRVMETKGERLYTPVRRYWERA